MRHLALHVQPRHRIAQRFPCKFFICAPSAASFGVIQQILIIEHVFKGLSIAECLAIDKPGPHYVS